MYRVLPALVLAAALAVAATGCSTSGPPHPRHSPPPASYYLSLGDSLAQGVQPDSSGASVETRLGYANQLFAALRGRQPGLRLVKLGCPGETTVTMIHGGICRYASGSQLAAAISFLRAHRGRVPLVTIDIGANDADGCITRLTLASFASCLTRSVPQVTSNLTKILTRLRQADPHGRIIAMSYYLPALAQWREGLAGQAVARLSELTIAGYNVLLNHVYQSFGVRVADVFGAFHTSDFSPQVSVPGFGSLPRNVAAICQWTWECTAPPRGPNVHANQAGYGVIAQAFLRADTPVTTARQ
ncbi:MAG TPA: SGNH/GDSL hydrolase family protein [Streptosporangiaceae bacterium]|nr:SGNH/GDSL hydrolase family protein [Streptosporangiaceae bacterium]